MRLPEPKPLYRYLRRRLWVCRLVALARPPATSSSTAAIYLVLAVFVVLGELLPIRVPRRDAEITTSTTFAYASS